MLTPTDIVGLLKAEVTPSLGCTEPACAAVCAADAARTLDAPVANVHLVLSPQLFKNGRSVGIPGYPEVGMDHAAALGAASADPTPGLQVFCGLTPQTAAQAQALMASGAVTVEVDPDHSGVWARATVSDAAGHEATTLIDGGHTRVAARWRDGQEVAPEQADGAQACAPRAGSAEHDRWVAELLQMRIAQIRELVCQVPAPELAFLEEGIAMNQAAAAQALAAPSAVGIGRTLQAGTATGAFGHGLSEHAVTQVAASIESRLDGAPIQVMSSAGAGSKGLAVLLPVAACAEEQGASTEQTLRALAFAHLVNSWINGHVGKLTSMCTCSLAASTAASAAMAWLMGADDEGIGRAVVSVTGTLAGLVCDGAKPGCGMKLAVATQAAVLAAAMGASGFALRSCDGIAGTGPEDAVEHVARLAHEGMAPADQVMLDIMAQA